MCVGMIWDGQRLFNGSAWAYVNGLYLLNVITVNTKLHNNSNSSSGYMRVSHA